MKLAFVYAVLALIATISNIASQFLFLQVYSGVLKLSASVAVGTAVGLVVKYLLDKRFVFRFRARDRAHDARTFAAYVAMGLVTTALFWFFEYVFQRLFGSDAMRYCGAAIGLALGYAIKYRLDKRFVFVAASA